MRIFRAPFQCQHALAVVLYDCVYHPHHVEEAQLLILDDHIYGQKLQISPKTSQNGQVNGFNVSTVRQSLYRHNLKECLMRTKPQIQNLHTKQKK